MLAVGAYISAAYLVHVVHIVCKSRGSPVARALRTRVPEHSTGRRPRAFSWDKRRRDDGDRAVRLAARRGLPAVADRVGSLPREQRACRVERQRLVGDNGGNGFARADRCAGPESPAVRLTQYLDLGFRQGRSPTPPSCRSRVSTGKRQPALRSEGRPMTVRHRATSAARRFVPLRRRNRRRIVDAESRAQVIDDFAFSAGVLSYLPSRSGFVDSLRVHQPSRAVARDDLAPWT